MSKFLRGHMFSSLLGINTHTHTHTHTHICGGVSGLVTKLCLTLCDSMDYIARQAPLSMGFPRQAYWSRLPFPSPEDLPDPGIEPTSSIWQVDSLPLSHLRSLSHFLENLILEKKFVFLLNI